ncbi:MAG: hypothetical protein ACO4CG_12965 [Prochlorothrix sp.]|nr:hypothetical protein [Prochlorothrix sp.]
MSKSRFLGLSQGQIQQILRRQQQRIEIDGRMGPSSLLAVLCCVALGCGMVLLLQGLAPQAPWLESLLGASWLLGSAWFAFYAEERDWEVPGPSVWLPWLK